MPEQQDFLVEFEQKPKRNYGPVLIDVISWILAAICAFILLDMFTESQQEWGLYEKVLWFIWYSFFIWSLHSLFLELFKIINENIKAL